MAVRDRFLEFNVRSPLESESESHLNPFAKCNIPVESESVESESVGISCKLHLNLNQLNLNPLNLNPLSLNPLRLNPWLRIRSSNP